MTETFRILACRLLILVLLPLGGCHTRSTIAPAAGPEPPRQCETERQTFDVSNLSLAGGIERVMFYALGSACTQQLSHGSEPCAGTSSTCHAQVHEQLARVQERSFHDSPERHRFVIAAAVGNAQGGLVVREGLEEIRQLLGPIDTPLEAWILVSVKLSAPLFECGEAGPDCLRKTEDGYSIVVRSFSRSCPLQYVDVAHIIRSNGELAEQPGEPRDEPTRCVN